jgi:hypothetical protein
VPRDIIRQSFGLQVLGQLKGHLRGAAVINWTGEWITYINHSVPSRPGQNLWLSKHICVVSNKILEENLPLIEEFVVMDYLIKLNLIMDGTGLIFGMRLLHVNFLILTMDKKLKRISALFKHVNIRLQIAIYIRSK